VLKALLWAASGAAAVFLILFVLAGGEFEIASSVSNQAQINESEFLASDARAAVAGGNPALGLQLAKLALPTHIDHPDRPFVPLAEYALEESVANLRAVQTIDSRDGPVWSAVYSKDGSRIATVADDGIVKVLNVMTGSTGVTVTTAATLKHDAPVTAAAFSPDGTRIATASRDGLGHIWDIASGMSVPLTGHAGALTSIAFSPDGKSILTASTDKTARLWDAASGNQIRVYAGYAGVVWSAAFSEHGDRIVTTSWEEAVPGDQASPKGSVRILMTDGSGTPKSIQPAPIPSRLGETWVLDAQFSPDGKCFVENGAAGTCIVTAGTDNFARIWNADTGTQVALLNGHQDWVNSAAFSSDGKLVITASLDKTIRLWSVAAAEPVAIVSGHGAAVDSAVLSPDGTYILSASEDHSARIWGVETEDQEGPALAPQQQWVLAAGFSPDRTQLLTAENVGSNQDGGTGEVRLWDLTKPGTSTVIAQTGGLMRFAAISPDGTRVVAASDDKTALLIDPATKTVIQTLKHDDGVWFAGFSRDSKYVVTTSGAYTYLWSALDGQTWMTLGRPTVGHTALVAAADFAPDDRHVVTASWDETSLIWDVADPLHPLALQDDGARFTWVVYSPDGAHVAVAADDGFVRIFDTQTRKRVSKVPVHDSLYSVAYSRDGKYLLTASKDRTARLWDAQTGDEIVALRGHSWDVRFATFSKDNTRVVTASQDGTARIWVLPPHCEELLQKAKKTDSPELTDDQKKEYFQSDRRSSWVRWLAGAGGHCDTAISSD
jgi:WD40 repeat protein